MGQEKSVGDQVIDELTGGVRKWFQKGEEKKPTVAAKDDRVDAANDTFRKRAESEKLAANRKLGAKPAPKKGKSTRKRAAKSY